MTIAVNGESEDIVHDGQYSSTAHKRGCSGKSRNERWRPDMQMLHLLERFMHDEIRGWMGVIGICLVK